jgi:hypothetical protein
MNVLSQNMEKCGGKFGREAEAEKLMLTAEGFWPVAPVWGRSEEERGVSGKQFPDPLELSVLPVACPRGEALLSTIFWHNPHTGGMCHTALVPNR